MAVWTLIRGKRFGEDSVRIIVDALDGTKRDVQQGMAVDISEPVRIELDRNYVLSAGGTNMAPVYTGDVPEVLNTVLARVLQRIAEIEAGGPRPDPGGIVPSGSFYDFIDSIGVNVHLFFTATAPDNAYEDHVAVRVALWSLGVRHVRDTYFNSATQRTRLRNLWTGNPSVEKGDPTVLDSGLRIRFQGIFDSRIDSHVGGTNTVASTQSLDILADNNLPEITAIEGPNEPDIQSFWGVDLATRMANAATFTQSLRAAADARTSLFGIPILAPSVADPLDGTQMGNLSAYVDVGNIHSYPGGYPPRANQKGSNQSLRGFIGHARTVAGAGKPVFATETGYHNQTPQTTGHAATSQAVAGVYAAQLPFEYWRHGVKRTYIYELFDQSTNTGQENRFGLFNYDRTEKPAATSLRRVISVLGDDSPRAPMTGLAYAVSATTTSQNDQIRTVLLQRSDGTWALVVWFDAQIWDPTTGAAQSVADVGATLSLALTRSLTIYEPCVSAAPTAVDVVTKSHPLVLRAAEPQIIMISGG